MKKENLLIKGTVPCGFPSPAEDYLAEPMDLHRHLIKHSAATFFVKVEGDSMVDAGIFSKDLLIVDRALTPVANDVVVAIVSGDFTVKRLLGKKGEYYLASENSRCAPVVVRGREFQIWGVVIHAIRSFR